MAACPQPPTNLAEERALLARLERIRRCAWEEGALGTPGLDRDIAATREAIRELEEAEALWADVEAVGDPGGLQRLADGLRAAAEDDA